MLMVLIPELNKTGSKIFLGNYVKAATVAAFVLCEPDWTNSNHFIEDLKILAALKV